MKMGNENISKIDYIDSCLNGVSLLEIFARF